MKLPLDMKTVRRTLEVVRDLYEKGDTSESNFILGEVFAALSDTKWYNAALRDWFTSWEPTAGIATISGIDIASALRPVALHLVEAGLRTRAARLIATMSGLSPLDLSQYSGDVSVTQARPSARARMEPEVVRTLKENGVRMLEIGLPQGIAVLSSSYHFAEPHAALSSQIYKYLKSLPSRKPVGLAKQEVETVANAAYDFHWSGRSESAVRLGLVLPSVSADYAANAPRVERLWEELADEAGTPLGMAPNQMAGAVDVGLKLNEMGYPAEGASVFLDSLDLKEDSPKWERLWQVVDRDVLSSTVKPPSRAGSHARGLYSTIIFASPTAGGPPSIQLASPAEPQPAATPSPRPRTPEGSGPPSQPKEPKDPGMPPCPPEFFFIFEGDARGKEVLLGAEVDLVFRCECPDPNALAAVKGKQIDNMKGKTVDLEITVHPVGLTLREGSVRQVAHFAEGKLQEPLPRFCLKAPDTKPEDCGLYVIFSIKGAILYDFFLEVELVEELSGEVRPAPSVNLDLEDLTNCHVEERELLVMISGKSKWEAYFVFHHEPSEIIPVGFDEASLAVALKAELQPLQLAAAHTVWVQLTENLQLPSGNEKSAHSCVEKVMSFGYSLYKALSNDPGLKQIFDRVESLPPGAKLTIWTTSFFVPWEVLYPKEFNYEYPEEKKKANFNPALFWGNRFQIECLLSSKSPALRYRTDRRQPGRLSITIGLNTAIDKKVPEEAKFKPVEFQTAYSRELGDRSELCDTAVKIKKVFQERDYPSTFIYLYCHGQASNPFIGTPELLQFADFEIQQSFLTDDIYAHWPIIFLNSCSAGAVSPLLFSSFLTKFRTKQAFGVVAPAFPVPILFAAGFGKKIIDRYINGVPIGKALWDLRRELLKQGNPLGLFYTLQCPMDVTAPEVRK